MLHLLLCASVCVLSDCTAISAPLSLLLLLRILRSRFVRPILHTHSLPFHSPHHIVCIAPHCSLLSLPSQTTS